MKSQVGRAEHARKAPRSEEPRKQEIKVVAYVHIGDRLVNVDDLDKEQRARLATRLKTTYLNELFRGEAVFWSAAEK